MKENDDAFRRSVASRTARMRKARASRSTIWRHVVHVGALGWMFILPIVLGAIAGRFLRTWRGVESAPVVGLGLGLLVGALLVFREVRSTLDEREDQDER